jgi:PAS domain S-box-containing protein
MSEPSAARRTSDEPIRILAVDDHPENLTALEAILDSPEYRIERASSGEEALKRLLREDFGLLLLDIVMPGMNGFEVAALVKRRERTRHMPIIFLTGASTGAEPASRAYALGALDYLEKPVDPAIVRAKVRNVIALVRKGEEIRRAAEVESRRARTELEAEVATLRAKSERRYRALVEAVPAIVFLAGPDGALEHANARFLAYTGLTLEQARGSGWIEAIHPDDLPAWIERWRAAVDAQSDFEGEVRLRRASDGAHRWHLCRAVAERENGAGPVGWIGTAFDIEEQKRTEAALEAARLRAEGLLEESRRAVALRDEFLSVASHELKTPLTALKLTFDMLRRALEGAPGEEIARKLAAMGRQQERLVGLVDQLLDVSRLSERRVELRPERVDMAALVRDTAARFEEPVARARATLTVEAPESLAGEWDPLRLEQIVTNLLSNAVKYGGGSPIRVRVEDRGETARLVVEDGGIGIAPDDRERIFRRFERAVPERSYGGLGLGLYIVHEAVRAHGGRISVDGAPGRGTTFTVDLPRRRAGGEEPGRTAGSPHARPGREAAR